MLKAGNYLRGYIVNEGQDFKGKPSWKSFGLSSTKMNLDKMDQMVQDFLEHVFRTLKGIELKGDRLEITSDSKETLVFRLKKKERTNALDEKVSNDKKTLLPFYSENNKCNHKPLIGL